MTSSSTSSLPLGWFSKHPLVMTLLWLCGSKNKNVDEFDSKSGRLSWRDNKGGLICDLLGKDSKERNASDSDVDANQSPQWGFYVSITPPVQESFVSTKGKTPKPAEALKIGLQDNVNDLE